MSLDLESSVVAIFQTVVKYQYHHSFYLYKFQCLKCSAEFTKPVSSDELLCPDCGSSMTVLISSPDKQDKPVFTVGPVDRFVGEHVGAAKLNTSSIKTLNGDMSVTALVDLSTSSSSSSYLEAVDQMQETEKKDNADPSNKNILPAKDKQYVLCLTFGHVKGTLLEGRVKCRLINAFSVLMQLVNFFFFVGGLN